MENIDMSINIETNSPINAKFKAKIIKIGKIGEKKFFDTEKGYFIYELIDWEFSTRRVDWIGVSSIHNFEGYSFQELKNIRDEKVHGYK